MLAYTALFVCVAQSRPKPSIAALWPSHHPPAAYRPGGPQLEAEKGGAHPRQLASFKILKTGAEKKNL